MNTQCTGDGVQTPTTKLIDKHAVALARIAELEAALTEACDWIADGCISAADEIMVNKLRKTLQQAG